MRLNLPTTNRRKVPLRGITFGDGSFVPLCERQMARESQTMFSLWLEFEVCQPSPTKDPEDECCNMQITLDDRRVYALNVWTYKFLLRAIADERASGEGLGGKYLLPPDMFVERLDRGLLEAAVSDLIATGAIREEWRVPHDCDVAHNKA